jgi:urease accessory protein
MLGVGLWASRLPRQQAGLTVAAFLSFMTIGAGLAVFWVAMHGVELGILASVFITGLLLMSAQTFSTALIAALFASFALLHGYAHGLEMPQAAQPINYAAGFLVATALLHGIGLSLGAMFNKQLRILGFITSGLGLWLLVNA